LSSTSAPSLAASAFSFDNATTLRLGYKFCIEHINELAINERLETDSMTSNKLFIFYKVARTSSNEIEQLAAWTSTGEHFSTFTNAPTEGARTSPILSKLSPAIYTSAAVEPKQAVADLMRWVSSIVAKGANKGMTESGVVMVAHKGMRLDHVVLVMMIMCGLSLPLWRLSDTLPIFEIVIKSGSSAKLSDLVYDYVPWLTHIENDAASDAEALTDVVKFGVINWDVVCYIFSTLCIDFTKSVVLNAVKPI
jgi:hypothetical protein